MSQYTYDTTGQSNFFFLTALLCGLIPATVSVFRASRVVVPPPPCKGWNQKSKDVKRAVGTKPPISTKMILLGLGWILFAFVVQRASQFQPEGLLFDPYKILGISTSSTEKEIKKHYRKLSLKFHPDKLVLAVNQTKEEADNHFVDLTKAYKSLTDEDIRKNYELFGHPDGKQEYQQGIALPSWVVASGNIWWVMGAYALGLGVLLPYFVGQWWYGSRMRTKDGVLNSTAAVYFQGLSEHITFPILMDLMAASEEFNQDTTLLKQRKLISKTGIDEYARLASIVREGVDGKEGWVGHTNWSSGKKRARVLLAAHLLRIPISDLNLLKEKHTTVSLAIPLTSSLTSITLAHNWLSTTILIIHLQQFIIQAVHPSSSPLYQLPFMNEDTISAAAKLGIKDISQFGKMKSGEESKVIVDLDTTEKKECFEVAKNWPVIKVVNAKFEVIGEKIVTPGSVVSFTVKLQMALPGVASKLNAVELAISESDAVGHVEEGKESTLMELIGRREKDADGEVASAYAHAPEFPKNRKPTWYIFIGDHKLNRIYVQPQKFSNVGPDSLRTIRMTFQAPPGAGLYTFQAYIMNDSFVGTDTQKDVRMSVNPPVVEEAQEDEISEPEEDSIAGQMALMKGQGVKRAGDNDDDTSGTEEESSEEESSEDESD